MENVNNDTNDIFNPQINNEDILTQVNNAIQSILIGGQSYKIGSRELNRADLSMLYQMKKDLTTQITNEKSNLLDNTYVAKFSGR